MIEQVEINSLDLRFEGCRIQSKAAENRLLRSISENGIREPLQGVDANDARILLNGFKRYRCAKKLSIGVVPYSSIGNDEALGIIELLRQSNAKSLNILEQAKLVDELKTVYHLKNFEIAGLLEKSKAWVSVRDGILSEMSETVINAIFKGDFPAYAYMYILQKFIRINRISKKEIDEFVKSVSGKNLSVREIEMLAHGYFEGSNEFREQIRNGNIMWGMNRLRQPPAAKDCTQIEYGMLRDLERLQTYMQRVISKSTDQRFKSNSFFAQANLLAGGVLRQIDSFSKTIKAFYDRSGQT